VILPSRADLVWSVEVAEHIPPECVGNYVVTMIRNADKAIVLTASQMEAPLHVSVHPPEWWQERLAKHGWRMDPQSKAIIWRHSTMAREFLRETGMIFRREVPHATHPLD